MNLKQKLKGGALYIALIICIIIGIILSVMILIAHFNQRQVLNFQADAQLEWDLRSAVHIAQSSYFSDSDAGQWKLLDNEDSLRLRTGLWGTYRLIGAEAKNNRKTLKEYGLYGSFLPADTALYMEDAGRPVSLAGTISLKGAAYFPAGGFRTAWLEGQGSVIDGSISRHIRQAGNSLPPVDNTLSDELMDLLKNPEQADDSLGSLDAQKITQPFSQKALLVRSGNFELSSCQLSRHIKLVANQEINVDSSAHLDNVLLIAAKVRFKKGFRGTVQVLASDSIVLEEGCRLDYPSSLTVLSEVDGGAGLKGIFIGEKCRVEGCLLALNRGTGAQKVTVTAAGGSEFYGLVYSSDYAGLQGTLYGSLLCTKLLLQTPSAVYENHLFNCSIDPGMYAGTLYVPVLFEKHKAAKCVKRL